MRYGVGITTRNRPDVLKTCLDHFTKFSISEATFVIVDDNSDTQEENDKIIKSFSKYNENYQIIHRRSSERLGISKAKNGCLAPLKDFDHVFLFDDDAWPISSDWADEWSGCAEATGVHHSMFNCDIPQDFYKVVSEHSVDGKTMCGWSNCFGVALHFSNTALKLVGGYDHINSHNVYGYEHAQMSRRAYRAGITNSITYPSPKHLENFIYSFDLSYRWLGIAPPIESDWFGEFTSSVTPDEAQGVEKNSAMMFSSDIFMPIVDPFGEF